MMDAETPFYAKYKELIEINHSKPRRFVKPSNIAAGRPLKVHHRSISPPYLSAHSHNTYGLGLKWTLPTPPHLIAEIRNAHSLAPSYAPALRTEETPITSGRNSVPLGSSDR